MLKKPVLLACSALALAAALSGPLPAAATGAAGNAALPANCTGESTSGNDIITCAGDLKDGDVVDAGAGDDTVTVKGDVPKGAKVFGGAGDDKVSVYDVGAIVCPGKPGQIGATSGRGGEVDAGDGTDTVVVGGGSRTEACKKTLPDTPAGNVAENGKVRGGKGNDKITVGTLGYIKSDAEHVDRSIEALAGRVEGGEGDDTLEAAWVATGTVFNKPDADGLYGGQGDDTIHAGNVNGLGLASGGPGKDSLTIDGMNSGLVTGDADDDTLTATKDPLTGLAKIRGGTGNDKITAKSLWLVSSVMGEEGDDTLDVESINGPEELFAAGQSSAYADGGTGNDKITVGQVGRTGSVMADEGDDTVDVRSVNGPEDKIVDKDDIKYHAAIVNGWSGNDKITIGVLGKRGQVWGDGFAGSDAEGKDTIKVTTINREGKVRGGPLADTITVTDITAKKGSVFGEQGPDKITVTGKNAGTVNGGAGKDVCKASGTKEACES